MKTAWGVSHETEYEVIPKHSLQQIMDETLAHKLQSDQDAKDYILLSPPKPATSSAPDMDADLAMALQLQEEEERDYQRRQALLHSNSSSHVHLSSHDPMPSISSISSEYDSCEDDFEDMVLTKRNIRSRDKIKGISKGRREMAARATSDAVLDQRTRLIVLKLMNAEELEQLHGVLRSGKEANVYAGMRCDDNLQLVPCAVKIFKTTLTAFRNRSEYVVGDFRFEAYPQQDIRRQTQVWTKKAFANLCRAEQAGIRVPHPFGFKEHVMILSFLGKSQWPAPQLREVSLSTKQMQQCMLELLQSMRQLYQIARLVHADLSPYNILYHDKTWYLIDFGQAVDTSHPMAETYLKRDIAVLHAFFENLQNVELVQFSVEDWLEYVTTSELEAFWKTRDIMQQWMQKCALQFTVTGKAKARIVE